MTYASTLTYVGPTESPEKCQASDQAVARRSLSAEVTSKADKPCVVLVRGALCHPCVYRKLKLGRSGGEVRQGWRVI